MLPTGLGKSLIYQSFVFGKVIINGHSLAEIEGFGEKRALGILLKTELCQKHSKSCMQFCLGALNKKPVFVVTSACDCKDGNFN